MTYHTNKILIIAHFCHHSYYIKKKEEESMRCYLKACPAYAIRSTRKKHKEGLHHVLHRAPNHALPPSGVDVFQRIEVERPHSRHQIHLRCLDEESALVPCIDFPEYEEEDDDDGGEVLLEEGLGTAGRGAADRLRGERLARNF